MKIMQVIPYIKNKSAGTTQAIINLCKYLQINGCDVTLYTLNPIPNEKFNFEIKSFETDWYSYPALGSSKKMYQALMKDAEEFDIIHSHVLWMAPSYYSGIVANKFNKPYIISPHGALTRWAFNRSRWKKNIVMLLGQKKALDNCDCFFVSSEYEKRELLSLFSNKNVKIIPLGIEPIKNDIVKNKREKTLIFMSRLHPVKGIANLIEAWKELENDFKDWKLIIIGGRDVYYEKKYPDKIKKLVEKYNLKRVFFTGALFGKEKDEYLRKGNLFVLPSYSENFALVIPEALMYKMPVITTNRTPWDEIEKIGCGWCINVGIESLLNSLKKAMSKSVEELEEMGEKGRKWIINNYNWDNIAKLTINHYKEILRITNDSSEK